MINLTNQINSPDTDTLEAEGEKVTGGSESGETNADTESTLQEATENNELMPDEESKKEEMTGYNEHPDQEKVGGG